MIYDRLGPSYELPFTPEPAPAAVLARSDKPKVAILRDEGSNSDREMTSAFYAGRVRAVGCLHDTICWPGR